MISAAREKPLKYKIAFLTHSRPQGYRIQHYFPFLEEMGFDVDHFIIPHGLRAKGELFGKMRDYDMVYLQRRLLSFFELGLLRRAARKLVYDVDDSVMYRSSGHDSFHSWSRMWKFKRVVRSSDAVLGGTGFLVKEVKKYIPDGKVFFIPTTVDLNDYQPKEYVEENSSVTLGWIGSRGTLQYLENLVPVFSQLAKKYSQLQLKIVADAFLNDCPIPVIKKPWKKEEQAEDLRSFDIGLNPLNNDLWSRGKSSIRVSKYMAAGIPMVSSPVGFAINTIDEGTNGFWANGEEEWIEKISCLIDNPGQREKIGLRARRDFEEKYSLQIVARKVAEIFTQVIEETI